MKEASIRKLCVGAFITLALCAALSGLALILIKPGETDAAEHALLVGFACLGAGWISLMRGLWMAELAFFGAVESPEEPSSGLPAAVEANRRRADSRARCEKALAGFSAGTLWWLGLGFLYLAGCAAVFMLRDFSLRGFFDYMALPILTGLLYMLILTYAYSRSAGERLCYTLLSVFVIVALLVGSNADMALTGLPAGLMTVIPLYALALCQGTILLPGFLRGRRQALFALAGLAVLGSMGVFYHTRYMPEFYTLALTISGWAALAAITPQTRFIGRKVSYLHQI